MKDKLRSLSLFLVAGTLLLSGCTQVVSTPAPAPTAAPTSEPTLAPTATASPPSDPVGARDAVLAYLAAAFGDRAPAAGLAWTEKHTKPEGLVGSESYEYTAADWVIAVSYPVVAPDNVVYLVEVSNQSSGFRWTGQVDAQGRISQTPEAEEEAVTITSRLQARDAALAYMAQNLPDEAPPAGLVWTEKRTTPEGLLGSETYEYTSGEWKLVVSYPVTAPESTIYRLVLTNGATGFQWEVEVEPAGEIVEFALQPGRPAPTPTARAAGATDPSAALAQGNVAFAWDLYRALSDQEGNLFLSPYSISSALAMTYAGARGETEAQMAAVLHFALPQAQLHPAFLALAQDLARRGEGAAGTDSEGFRLNIANSLWGQEGYDFLDDYLRLLSANYGAGLQRVDFSRSEEARATINRWVEEQTEDRIKDLIPSGVLDALTRLVLANAIYFNAAWATPFETRMTVDGPFTRLDGSQVTVPMMRNTTSLGYAEVKGFQAVELPYDGYQVSMVILLPAAGQFEGWQAALDASVVEAALQQLAPRQVALSLPRFEFDSSFSLKDTLSAMGMPLPFTPEADFSGMTGSRELFIGAVLHKAFVSVDEAGTEAAAATAVIMELTAAPTQPLEVKVDRPFLFLIRDRQTGTILFLGRVLDPSA